MFVAVFTSPVIRNVTSNVNKIDITRQINTLIMINSQSVSHDCGNPSETELGVEWHRAT